MPGGRMRSWRSWRSWRSSGCTKIPGVEEGGETKLVANILKKCGARVF